MVENSAIFCMDCCTDIHEPHSGIDDRYGSRGIGEVLVSSILSATYWRREREWPVLPVITTPRTLAYCAFVFLYTSFSPAAASQNLYSTPMNSSLIHQDSNCNQLIWLSPCSPGDVSYVIPSEGSYYKERPSRHAFFYSESRFPGIPSLPRVPAGLESLQQAPEPRYPTAHAGVGKPAHEERSLALVNM